MRKRRVASVTAAAEEETLQNHGNNPNEKENSEGNGFFACYLLTSLSPRYKGHTYIGFTVNPRRRIRQHNGEIRCGAYRTKKRRPWEMVLCIYGFPTNVSALQFEWAWQHPVESLAVRKAAVEFKSLSGIANKIKLAYTMLTLPSWQSMNITVNFFSTKYMKHCGGCPSLPAHMKTKTGSLDELPCYSIYGLSENEDDNVDDVEFDDDNNNTSASGSVPDVSDDLDSPDSPKNQIHGEKISEAFEWIKESEVPEASSNSLSSQEQRLPISSTTPLTMKSSSSSTTTTTLLQRIEIIEEADFMNVVNKSDSGLIEPAQSDAALAANTNRTVVRTFVVPHEAEIVDLSTPSPSCRSVLDRKKRRVSSSVTDFIDLTNSPNFVQL
ncbi:structure-specific endonuclease subunit SLX1 homolog 1 isoform X1 [Vigna umbellata]|uniref:structure-specific endonuclease subunit SLX1 homolog 1 isoform X1 n=1 Tax=Vigna umbellata TaxID=87088 RepID=UPI001F5F0264|nr:structure-specific endonuclease subunit SLX1 homolog 1 isoform X1 [Vigna umbellata]